MLEKEVTDELAYSFDLLEEFFRQSRIQKSLAAIEKHGITGWEKWWQVELAMFLSEDEDIAEWDMEVPFLTDRRQKPRQDSILIDIAFRPKKLNREKFIFLELKQDPDYVNCLRKMLSDAERSFAAQSRSVDGIQVRSILTVGVYPSVKKNEIRNCLDSIQADYGVAMTKQSIKTKSISNTPYSFTILEPLGT